MPHFMIKTTTSGDIPNSFSDIDAVCGVSFITGK